MCRDSTPGMELVGCDCLLKILLHDLLAGKTLWCISVFALFDVASTNVCNRLKHRIRLQGAQTTVICSSVLCSSVGMRHFTGSFLRTTNSFSHPKVGGYMFSQFRRKTSRQTISRSACIHKDCQFAMHAIAWHLPYISIFNVSPRRFNCSSFSSRKWISHHPHWECVRRTFHAAIQ